MTAYRITNNGMFLIINILLSSIFIRVTSPTAITHVDSIFETFSARSLIRFFEFNSNGFNLTNNCGKEIFVYLEALQKDLLWAMKCKLK